MIDIPPEVVIKATIRLGSVYYFPEESFSSSESHYFIVINKDPLEDKIIFLVYSSQIDKVKQRRRICPSKTLVEISPTQYKDLKKESIIDCNYVLERSIDQLVEKLSRKELQLKTEMDLDLVKRLREGVLISPLIENRIKNSLFSD